MRRILNNLIRLPARTWRGLWRWTDPAYRLQTQADRLVPTWFKPEHLAALHAIPGFTSKRELNLLTYLAAISPAGGSIVEIGAYKGRSTAWLVEAATRRRDQTKVVSIDPHLRDTWDDYQRVLDQFRLPSRGLTVHRSLSSDVGKAWSEPISFLWVDGSHEYEDVLEDIRLFTPHVVGGGWVVFDDAHGGHFPGVERAIQERMFGQTAFEHVGTLKHFEIFRKKATSPA
jgi:predicted O-methyltransferase YrrM